MDILEAAKSGKPFRRKHWPEWCSPDVKLHFYWQYADVTATDWEIKSETREFYVPDYFLKLGNHAIDGDDRTWIKVREVIE
jgi:hypothetical protein